MAERRALVEGLKPGPVAVEPGAERRFVFGEKEPAPAAITTPISRSPISTRIRSDYATALKRASLERQLAGVTPSTLQDILEEAIEPWLRGNGYLP